MPTPSMENLVAAAKRCAYVGTDAARWKEWRKLVSESAQPLSEVLQAMRREYLRWFARYCFEAGSDDEGVVAYETLLNKNLEVRRSMRRYPEWSIKDDVETNFDRNGTPAWIYPHEATEYLSAVRRVRGDEAVVEALARFDELDATGYPEQRLFVAEVEATLGQTESALRRMRDLVRRHHTSANYHEALARLAMKLRHQDEALFHFKAAAKRGKLPTEPIDLSPIKSSMEELIKLRDEYQTPALDQLLDDFIAQPGHTLLAADAGEAAPHVYGGGSVTLPPCASCDRQMLLLATIDVRDAASVESSLAPLVGKVDRVPLPHCDHCQAMFQLPDYQLSEDQRSLEHFGPVPSRVGNVFFERSKSLTMQPARLVPVSVVPADEPDEAAFEIDRIRDRGPQIGGRPRPINTPRRRFCPKCDEEQLFVAAFCDAESFQTRIATNPDGYTYYFVCGDCRIISTDLDNT